MRRGSEVKRKKVNRIKKIEEGIAIFRAYAIFHPGDSSSISRSICHNTSSGSDPIIAGFRFAGFRFSGFTIFRRIS